MNVTDPRRSLLSRQLEAYEESWKSDHLAAQDCYDREEMIAVGVAFGEALERVHRQWREGIFRGVEAFDPRIETLLRTQFQLYLRLTEVVLTRSAEFEETFGIVRGLAELREVRSRIEKQLAEWTTPKVASAIGSRDQQLSDEDAANLDALLSKPAPSPPARQFEEQDSSFLQ